MDSDPVDEQRQRPPHAPASPANAGPVRARERVVAIDVARGIAMLGILLINIRLFAGPGEFEAAAGPAPHTGVDAWTLGITAALAQNKMLSSFALLFGVGLALLHDRLSARRSPWPVLIRRLVVLGCVGVAHAVLIWSGDILALYAVAGLITLMFLRRRQVTLVVWASVLLGLVGVGVLLATILGGLFTMDATAQAAVVAEQEALVELAEGARHAYVEGTYADQVAQRRAELRFLGPQLALIAPAIVGLMLVGIATWRSGIITREDPAPLRRAARIGLGIGLPVNVLGGVLVGAGGGSAFGIALVGQGLVLMGGPVLAIGYLAVIALAFRRRPGLAVWGPLAAVGRTAFTNYLLQSVLCVTVFVGFGLYGSLSLTASMLVVAAVWAIALIWSPLWLRRFHMGPLEWLWRAATYLRVTPLRRT